MVFIKSIAKIYLHTQTRFCFFEKFKNYVRKTAWVQQLLSAHKYWTFRFSWKTFLTICHSCSIGSHRITLSKDSWANLAPIVLLCVPFLVPLNSYGSVCGDSARYRNNHFWSKAVGHLQMKNKIFKVKSVWHITF